MGYRSDVRIITSKKGFDELRKFTDQYLKEKNCTYGNLLDELDIDKETNCSKYFGWDSIKWYEDLAGYEEVDAIMEGLKHLADNNYSYRYARIGEDYGDYDESYNDSNLKEEQDLNFPEVDRSFCDNITIHYLKKDKEDKSKQVDIKTKKDDLER